VPVLTVAVAVLLRRERVTAWKLGGLAVALAGALVVTGAWRFRDDSARVLTGNLLIVGNTLCFAAYLVVSRDVLARVEPVTAIAFTFLFGALLLIPLGARDAVSAAPHLHARTWLAVAYVLAFPTVGTYLLTAWSLARAPSSLVAIYVYVQPIIGALLAALLLNERPSITVLLGAPLIFTGIWLAGRDAARARRAVAAVV
jgi:drug/metabolite transporter (DMT)-like permease